ncbi:competence type IV pilus minor pilin ComGE [Bacillus sp. JJ722]|uniref:competence type IV pilus minor pilin ComGE n=1 Tax=Bacillus sp. JJ722 TaxID=3122973 RepID=UPI0030004F11
MNSKGYILLDVLGALSIVLFVCIALLPLLFKMENDRQDLREELEAHHILYENLQRYTLQQEIASVTMIKVHSGSFRMTIQPFEINGLYVKGCVSYQDSREEQISICDVVKARAGIYTD